MEHVMLVILPLTFHLPFVSCDLHTWYWTVFSRHRRISPSLFFLPSSLQKTTFEAMVS